MRSFLLQNVYYIKYILTIISKCDILNYTHTHTHKILFNKRMKKIKIF